MTLWKLILSIVLASLIPLPSEAQRLAPVALRITHASMPSVPSEPVALLTARRDTVPASRPVSALGGLVGGVLGGVLGTFAGAYVAGLATAGCQGEDCGLVSVILGAGIGESIGVGLGAHVGSGSLRHGNILLSSLTSTGILVGGTMLGVAMREAGIVMVPLTPALQLAAALMIESP